MIARVILLLAVPWLSPLSFGLHVQGWHVGSTGTTTDRIGATRFVTSVAWAANVRCVDCATADPPNVTLGRLPRTGIVVRARIDPVDGRRWPPGGRRLSPRLSLADAYRFRCCETGRLAGGEWELYALGPRGGYRVLVRVYWGSGPTKAMVAAARHAIRTLRLPAVRAA